MDNYWPIHITDVNDLRSGTVVMVHQAPSEVMLCAHEATVIGLKLHHGSSFFERADTLIL